jgi:hypothetical protein
VAGSGVNFSLLDHAWRDPPVGSPQSTRRLRPSKGCHPERVRVPACGDERERGTPVETARHMRLQGVLTRTSHVRMLRHERRLWDEKCSPRMEASRELPDTAWSCSPRRGPSLVLRSLHSIALARDDRSWQRSRPRGENYDACWRITAKRIGPCAPCTRIFSISAVLLDPLIMHA